jgi:hypothetical protein
MPKMPTKLEWDDSLPQKGKEAWKRATKEQKEEALRHAADFITTLPFYGQKLNPRQRLSWPRKGVNGRDGKPIVGIPEEIKEATYLVASFVLAKIPFDATSVAFVFALIGHLIHEDLEFLNRNITWH